MKNRTLLRTGIVGAVIAAICCFTPALVFLLAAFGIAWASVAWLEFYVLFPALGLCLVLIGYALIAGAKKPAMQEDDPS